MSEHMQQFQCAESFSKPGFGVSESVLSWFDLDSVNQATQGVIKHRAIKCFCFCCHM